MEFVMVWRQRARRFLASLARNAPPSNCMAFPPKKGKYYQQTSVIWKTLTMQASMTVPGLSLMGINSLIWTLFRVLFQLKK
ncbi:MAG: hypothetical protein DSY70_01755 [Desulfobulbus sp.]|nr:MAG: hypothetical protein DSY70_01755 [Desulfobulbus sp.]